MKTTPLLASLGTALALYAAAATAAPTVYIPLGTGNQVIAVDAATDRITATYANVIDAHGLVATPDGEYLIAGSVRETPAKEGSTSGPISQLHLVHPQHGHVMQTIAVTGWTHHQAITPDGRHVISTHPTRGNVSVVDLQSNRVVKTIATGPAPNYTVVTRDGARAFVSNSGSGNLTEIDLKTWAVSRTLQAGPAPEHLVLSADERTVYALNPRAGSVTAVSVRSGKAVNTFMLGGTLHGLDIGADGQRLFVSDLAGNRLIALDPRDGSRRELALSPAPYHLNTIQGTNKVYVSSRSEPVIWVVDQDSLRLVGTIRLPGGAGHQMAVVR
ncbi:MAG: YncE family protein [Rubrivivax sp.]|nr:YncE family protein [Rubrivivax sp.]